MKESETSEAYVWGLNLKGIFGVRVQSAFFKSNNGLQSCGKDTDRHTDNKNSWYLSLENFCILNVILNTEFDIILCCSQIKACK